MAYESPISVWWSDTKIEQLRDEYDNLIIKAVKNVCPEVDRDELIKALEYDRGQYEKGFADGIAYKPSVKSRGDSIRAMSDEELAAFFAQQEYRKPVFDGWLPLCNHVMGPRTCHENGCEKCWEEWLKQEAAE